MSNRQARQHAALVWANCLRIIAASLRTAESTGWDIADLVDDNGIADELLAVAELDSVDEINGIILALKAYHRMDDIAPKLFGENVSRMMWTFNRSSSSVSIHPKSIMGYDEKNRNLRLLSQIDMDDFPAEGLSILDIREWRR